VLQPVGSLVANGDDRGRQPLDVAVLVPAHRPRVVRRDDAAPDLAARPAIGPDDEDQPEIGQLILGQADGRVDELLMDVLQPIGVDRCGDPIADRRSSHEGPGRRAPRIDRQVHGELRRDEDR